MQNICFYNASMSEFFSRIILRYKGDNVKTSKILVSLTYSKLRFLEDS